MKSISRKVNAVRRHHTLPIILLMLRIFFPGVFDGVILARCNLFMRQMNTNRIPYEIYQNHAHHSNEMRNGYWV